MYSFVYAAMKYFDIGIGIGILKTNVIAQATNPPHCK